VEKPGSIKKTMDTSQAKKGGTEKKSSTELHTKAPDGGKGGSGHCPWHILGVLGVQGQEKVLACSTKDCELNHSVTTVGEAAKALSENGFNDMVISVRLKEKIKSVLKEKIPGWG
jgi:hypothetical protein